MCDLKIGGAVTENPVFEKKTPPQKKRMGNGLF